MKVDWNILLGRETPLPDDVEHEVLMAEDGAFGVLVASFTNQLGERFLGVAVDRVERGVTRWMEARLADAEWDSIHAGFFFAHRFRVEYFIVVTLRKVFQERLLRIVDRGVDLRPQRAWSIDADMLDPALLPGDGAALVPTTEPEMNSS